MTGHTSSTPQSKAQIFVALGADQASDEAGSACTLPYPAKFHAARAFVDGTPEGESAHNTLAHVLHEITTGTAFRHIRERKS